MIVLASSFLLKENSEILAKFTKHLNLNLFKCLNPIHKGTCSLSNPSSSKDGQALILYGFMTREV